MIAIHQSQLFPWAPYFYKIFKSDKFVVLDDVQFEKNGLQNRNMIKTPQGALWYTLPVSVKLGDKINQVQVSDVAIYDKLLKTLESNYKKSLCYTEVYGSLKNLFESKYELLNEFNQHAMNAIFDLLKIKPQVYYSSELKTSAKKDDLVIEIIKSFGEKEYLSGRGALQYMDLNKFKRAGIDVYVMKFEYRPYKQLWEKQNGFVPDLSLVDLMFNDLQSTVKYVEECGSIEKVTV